MQWPWLAPNATLTVDLLVAQMVAMVEVMVVPIHHIATVWQLLLLLRIPRKLCATIAGSLVI
jgi:hypothetical protein